MPGTPEPPGSLSARTILAFDYGAKRTGVAIGQELTASARPLLTIKTRLDADFNWPVLTRLVDEWRPALLVVGVPAHADGSANDLTHAAAGFACALAARFNLPVETIDERLSSHEARALLAGRGSKCNKAAIDRVAAALILQSWFSQRGITCTTSSS